MSTPKELADRLERLERLEQAVITIETLLNVDTIKSLQASIEDVKVGGIKSLDCVGGGCKEQELSQEVERLKEQVSFYKLQGTQADCEWFGLTIRRQSSELERMREAIRNVPHHDDCATRREFERECDCGIFEWKSRALSSSPAEQPTPKRCPCFEQELSRLEIFHEDCPACIELMVEEAGSGQWQDAPPQEGR